MPLDHVVKATAAAGQKIAGLQVASLGSGSGGNSTLIRTATTNLLLDCGFTLKETVARLATLGLTLDDLDAILVSHEHSDHVRGLGPIARKCSAAVWITHGSYDAWRDKKIERVHFCTAHQPFAVGDISVDPFPTPHDAAESCQYVFSIQACARADDEVDAQAEVTAGEMVGHGTDDLAVINFVVLTDLGVCTPHIMEKLKTANALLIECNYDLEMLRNGPYPASLQSRIRSRFGHLGNQQSAELLAQIDHPRLDKILLGHLSERNNTPQLAYETVSAYIENADRIHVLEQHAASQWFEITQQGIAKRSQVMAAVPAPATRKTPVQNPAEQASTNEGDSAAPVEVTRGENQTASTDHSDSLLSTIA